MLYAQNHPFNPDLGNTFKLTLVTSVISGYTLELAHCEGKSLHD